MDFFLLTWWLLSPLRASALKSVCSNCYIQLNVGSPKKPSEKPADDLSMTLQEQQKREKVLPGVIYLLISYQQYQGAFRGSIAIESTQIDCRNCKSEPRYHRITSFEYSSCLTVVSNWFIQPFPTILGELPVTHSRSDSEKTVRAYRVSR